MAWLSLYEQSISLGSHRSSTSNITFFHVVQVLLRLQRVVNPVVALLVELARRRLRGCSGSGRARWPPPVRAPSARRSRRSHSRCRDRSIRRSISPCLATVIAPARVITTKQSLSRAMASSTSAASPSCRPVNAVLDIARTRSSIECTWLRSSGSSGISRSSIGSCKWRSMPGAVMIACVSRLHLQVVLHYSTRTAQTIATN